MQASAVELGAGGVAWKVNWLVNPGVPIPAEATAIHKITNEEAAKGVAPVVGVSEMVRALENAWAAGLPVIICNAPYDLTLLALEAARVGLHGFKVGPVLDPLVIDRAIDKYRPGRRTLAAMAAHYGVKQDGAHSADGDALTAARVVWAQSKRHWALEKHTLEQMQTFQREACAEWAAGYQQHLRKTDPAAVIDGSWPMKKFKQLEVAA